jgi:SAM-dependent methyltransferase
VPRLQDEELFADLIDAGSREHYADAALYDYEYRRRRADVNFYRQFAHSHFTDLGSSDGSGTIVELGAGSGRVSLPLARDGHHVVAIDQSAAMITRLQQRSNDAPKAVALRLQSFTADLRTFSFPKRKFDLIIAPFNVIEHLYTRVELAACLARVAEHLTDKGRFVFDVQMPDLSWLNRDPNKRWARTKFTDPTSGKKFIYSTNHDYDPVTQIALIRIYYEPVGGGKTKVVKLSQRKFFPAELEALLAHNGFRMAERYGDFQLQPLSGFAESQVLVCARSTRNK